MLKKLLEAAKRDGMTFHCSYDCENVDYVGDNIKHAVDAMNACDMMNLRLVKEGEVVGWLLWIPENDGCERVCDYAGQWLFEYLEGK